MVFKNGFKLKPFGFKLKPFGFKRKGQKVDEKILKHDVRGYLILHSEMRFPKAFPYILSKYP